MAVVYVSSVNLESPVKQQTYQAWIAHSSDAPLKLLKITPEFMSLIEGKYLLSTDKFDKYG